MSDTIQILHEMIVAASIMKCKTYQIRVTSPNTGCSAEKGVRAQRRMKSR
jgi:hypothetical protein